VAALILFCNLSITMSSSELSHALEIYAYEIKCRRWVWRYLKGKQNPYIEEQTTQWPKEKVQKDKQRSTKHTPKTKDRVTCTLLKTRGELRCSGRVGVPVPLVPPFVLI
jgi:hypothetical protein